MIPNLIPGLGAGLPGLGTFPNGGLPGLPGSLPGLQTLGRPSLPTGLPGLPGLGTLPSGLPLAPGALHANLMRPQMPGMLRPLGVQAPGPVTAPPLAAATSKASGPAPPGPVAPAAPAAPPPAAAAPSAAPCTVYVGRISTEVSDDFVRQLLEKCGKVSKWNRAADPNTAKLTSFGFCDFEEPQGVWRALEFLHEKQLCDKRLLVKCEEKAKQTIDTWKDSRRIELAKKRADGEPAKDGKEGEDGKKDREDKDGEKKEGEKKEGEKKEGEKKDGEEAKKPEVLTDEQLEEELRKESKEAEEEVIRLLKDKNKGYPDVKIDSAADDKGDAKAVKDDKGDAAKDKAEEKDGKDKAGGDSKKEEPANDRGKENNSNRRSRDRKRSPEPKLSREEERKRQREEEKRAPVSRHYRPSRRERDREQRVKDRDRDIDKEYQYRIREFERSEDQRVKALKRDLRDLEGPGELSEREKRKLVDRDVTFGRSDADERDWKRYREDRQRDRAREAEKDKADREAEQKEIDDERRKKEEEEQAKRREEEEKRRKEKEAAEAEKRRQREEERRQKEEEARRQQEELERQREEERKKREVEQKKQQEAAAAKLLQSVQEEMRTSTIEKIPLRGGTPGQTPVSNLFNEPEELDANGKPRKHKPLTRLDGPPAQEVKLRDDEMRRLIQQVPTDKAKAFQYDIDWDSVHDHNIIEKKLRPWVKKKVTEYLGAEEQGMIEFIMRKVASHTKPDIILAELEGFLDEEAENFTLKMWRMLIFEVLRVKAR